MKLYFCSADICVFFFTLSASVSHNSPSFSLSVSSYYPNPSPANFTSLFTTYLPSVTLPSSFALPFSTLLYMHLFPCLF